MYSFVNIEEVSSYQDVSKVIDCSKFCSLTKLRYYVLQRMYVLRFIQRLKDRTDDMETMKELTSLEIRQAEKYWIKSIQSNIYLPRRNAHNTCKRNHFSYSETIGSVHR
jgi:hypothetical protein